MRLIEKASDLKPGGRRVCLAIGFFDGVHLGHQQVIRQAIIDAHQHDAISLVVTFDRHPRTVVAPERVPPMIYSLEQRLRAIEELQVDAVLAIPFTREFSHQSGEAFVQALHKDVGRIHTVSVGANFHFGFERSGDTALLKRLGEQSQFKVHSIAAISLNNHPISSTRIREAIALGRLEEASQMMGRPYSIASTVIKGAGIGRKLGFPTANLDIKGRALPPQGVYAVRVIHQAKHHQGVTNIGVRPTLENQAPRLHMETHLLDFHQDLYGQELEIEFVERLRDEERFQDKERLRTQIARDIKAARMVF